MMSWPSYDQIARRALQDVTGYELEAAGYREFAANIERRRGVNGYWRPWSARARVSSSTDSRRSRASAQRPAIGDAIRHLAPTHVMYQPQRGCGKPELPVLAANLDLARDVLLVDESARKLQRPTAQASRAFPDRKE